MAYIYKWYTEFIELKNAPQTCKHTLFAHVLCMFSNPSSFSKAHVRRTAWCVWYLHTHSSLSLWEKHEWKYIVCWHIINASFDVIMSRLQRVLCSQGCTIACGLKSKSRPTPIFLLDVSFQLVLSRHEYQWGLVFLAHVCGIVQALF